MCRDGVRHLRVGRRTALPEVTKIQPYIRVGLAFIYVCSWMLLCGGGACYLWLGFRDEGLEVRVHGLRPIEGKAVRSVNALLPIGVMLVGMVYGTLASGVEQHYLELSGFGFSI